MTLKTIAFLGVGIMGAPMARHLAAAGFSVRAWNRTRAKAAALADIAQVADTPADAARGADATVLMLEHGAAVASVLFEGDHPAAPASPRGALVVDMSSIDPPRARAHAARLRSLGLRPVDAPVSGGEKGALEAQLAIMAGGADADVAAAAPLFAALGSVTHVGGAGAGQVAKLANQTIVGVAIGAVAEALRLAEQAGCDPAAVRTALLGGFAGSRILELHGQRMIDRDFAPGAPVRVQLKDLENALAEAQSHGLTLPLTTTAREAFAALKDPLGHGEKDHAAYWLWLEALARTEKSPG